jgi:hypothetical protein
MGGWVARKHGQVVTHHQVCHVVHATRGLLLVRVLRVQAEPEPAPVALGLEHRQHLAQLRRPPLRRLPGRVCSSE